jgi:hypothetical protein
LIEGLANGGNAEVEQLAQAQNIEGTNPSPASTKEDKLEKS